MYLWILLVIVLIILVLLVIFWPQSQNQVIFYIRYPVDQSIQEGTFGTDPIVATTRIYDIYSDSNLSNKVGYMQTQNEYVTYPLDNQMVASRACFVNFTGGDLFTLSSIYTYISNPPAKPTTLDFSNAYVLSSTNSYYISKRFNVTNVQADIYQVTIN